MKRKLLKIYGALLVALLVCSSQGYSQSITGKWWGLLTLNGFNLRLEILVEPGAEAYKAQIVSPDQSPLSFPLDSFDFKFPVLRMKKTDWNLKYEGLVDAQYTRIEGTFNQYDNTVKLVFSRDSLAPPECSFINIQSNYDKKEVYITMRDGIRLFTSFYTPKDTSKTHPMLLYRTPYNSEPGGPDNFNYIMLIECPYLKENYIMAFQDVRGRYMSEGDFEDIRPFIPDKKSDKDIDEASDTYDAVDWLVKNVPHNNGKVGVYGISYPGFYSTMAILSAHPAIKAVSPQAPIADWFLGDDMHHNGAMFVLDAFTFYYSFGRQRKEPTRNDFPRFAWPEQDNYQFMLEQGTVGSLKKKFFDDSIKFFNDAYAHPNYDDFWKSRDPLQYLKNVKPAVLTVGGWFDAEDLYGALHTYSALEKQNPSNHPNFLVMGPWWHSQWGYGTGTNVGNIYWGQDANLTYKELEMKFFDYYLLGKGNGDFNEATIFITGENKWKTFSSWPPKDAKEQDLYLQPGGKLAFTRPAEDSSFDEYMTDPNKPVPYAEKVHQDRTVEYMTDDQRFAEKRPDVMVYKTDTLTEDITLAGPLTAQLFVSTTGTDADFIVKLIDVLPEYTQSNEEQKKNNEKMGGYEMLVRAEVMRGKYRHSFEKPEAFIPNVITEVKFDLNDIAHTFKKGHRIMIQVQNSWFPLVDRNPQKFVDIYNCTEADFQKAMQRLYHDKKHPSNLKVNVLQ
jgi:putative CocE/NonD family hydrolase